MSPEEDNILKHSFNIVSDWLKYAETKNGTLTAFNGAAVFGILQSLDHVPNWLAAVVITILLSSTLTSILSFLPRVNNVFKKEKLSTSEYNIKKTELNHIFFAHIRLLDKDQMSDLLKLRYSHPFDVNNGAINDWLNQIIVNSEIAYFKTKMFTLSVRLSLASVFIALIFMLMRIVGVVDHLLSKF